MKKLFVTIACAVLAIGSMNAQDLSQATETYNNGATCLSSGDFEGALEAFQQAYTIASSLGEEGQEVADNCKNAIPEVSLNLAKSLAQNDDIDGAVARLNSTVELATEYGSQSVLDEAKALIPQLLLQKGNDLLNSIIGLFTNLTDPILWKGESLVMISLIIAMIWQAVGYYMVMYMASMAAVPLDIYESSSIDGAGRVRQFFQITIPLIWTNIRTTLTFFIISTINMAFLFVKAMTSGGPNGASEVALSYMYGQKDAGLYGYSMAIGVVIFLFSFLLSALVNRATKRTPLEF